MRLRILFGLLLVFCLVPVSVLAQGHPCDAAPPPPNPSLVAPVAAGFCHNGKDANGQTVVLTKFTVKVDGVQVFDGPLAPVGNPSATGFNYYETPKTLIPTKGQHTATVIAWTSGGASSESTPFVFTIVDPVALPPINLIIR